MKGCSVASNSVVPCTNFSASLPCPWDFPGKSTGVGCHSLLQRILPTQGSNPGLSHSGELLYHCATWEALCKGKHGQISSHAHQKKKKKTQVNKRKRTSLLVQWVRITCQCRGYEFDSWTGETAQARATMPVCHNC